MKYKICPICDQKMSRAHYCDHCRQWIRNPLSIDVNYYLNERHPESEHDCSYHDYNDPAYNMPSQQTAWQPARENVSDPYTQTSTARSTASAQSARQNTPYAPSVQPARQAAPYAPSAQPARQNASSGRPARPPAVPNRPRGTSQTTHTGYRTAIAAVIIILFCMAVMAISLFSTMSRSLQRRTPEIYEGEAWSGNWEEDAFDDLTEPWIIDEADDEGTYESWDLEDEEVIAAGVNCNTYGHFQVTGQQLREGLLAYMTGHGYSVDAEDSFSSNTEDSYGYASYNKYSYCYFESGLSLEIHTDTATDRLHSISAAQADADEALEIAEEITVLLRDSGDWPLSEAVTKDWLGVVEDHFSDNDFVNVTPEELDNDVKVFLSSDGSDKYYISFDHWGD